MKFATHRYRWKLPVLIHWTVPVLVGLLAACSGGDRLDRIRERGELLVVSRNSPTTYYLDKNPDSRWLRFDIISILKDSSDQWEVRHFKDAFF